MMVSGLPGPDPARVPWHAWRRPPLVADRRRPEHPARPARLDPGRRL